MENYSLLMGDSSGDEDGGGVDGEAFGGTSRPAACRTDSCPPDLGFAMAAALDGFSYRGFFINVLGRDFGSLPLSAPQICGSHLRFRVCARSICAVASTMAQEYSVRVVELKELWGARGDFCRVEQRSGANERVPGGQVLGYFISARGIEANPLKIKAILDMEPPKNLHQVQQLAGRLAALSRFIAKLGEKALPFYNLMKKSEKFEWTKEAQESFDNLKKILSTSPVLVTMIRV
ncbi:hypothetical protein QYE76_044558 [Lolium multiflorum]|uniref:Reverse transcriptase/retrotransposon-derived protein RNase H-like domain-containing protein n=1 Tax=Lolium multiflorum TaxID=4521 RepID=A0AAD8TJF2_LOLMU|nr:hypothetical protein QYE76_044558 [Lolium multiflorum]